ENMPDLSIPARGNVVGLLAQQRAKAIVGAYADLRAIRRRRESQVAPVFVVCAELNEMRGLAFRQEGRLWSSGCELAERSGRSLIVGSSGGFDAVGGGNRQHPYDAT